MKKVNVLVLGLVVAMGLSSCIKDGETFDQAAQYELEKPIIEEYANEKLSNPEFSEEWGIWFEILDPGETDSYEYKIVGNSIEAPRIAVRYTGRLVPDGTQFDENNSDAGWETSLASTILGWHYTFLPKEIDGESVRGLTQEGLQVGSRIRVVIPSYLAYGNQAREKIPANTPLDFEIEVLAIASPSGAAN